MTNLPSCCQPVKKTNKSGFINGLIAGIIPHTFCILFVIFSVIGATSATFIFKGLLLDRNFFYYLIGLSFIFASLSAFFYLRKNNRCSSLGIKNSWKYLSILYGTTISINLLLFLVIFPMTANYTLAKNNQAQGVSTIGSQITLRVDIPCSGHATLITSEIKKLPGINQISFRLPNLFDVSYNPSLISSEKILSLEVFKTYPVSLAK